MSDSFPFSRVLVTGGAGFVGSHIVDRLIEYSDVEVTVLDNFSSGSASNLTKNTQSKRVKVVKGEINDKEQLKKCLKETELVFHQAAIVSVQRSISEPELTNKINVEGTKSVLDESVKSKVKRVVVASSAAVYGDPGTMTQSEITPPNPLSPYASSKLESERICNKATKSTGLETVALRYFNIYGERSVAGPYAGVINIFADLLIAKERPIIYGNGMQTRDFVNVKDVVAANILAATRKMGECNIFNVGTGRAVTITDLARLENEIISGNSDIEIEFKDARAGDVQHSCADISLIRKELGFEPVINLKDGLQDYISYLFNSR